MDKIPVLLCALYVDDDLLFNIIIRSNNVHDTVYQLLNVFLFKISSCGIFFVVKKLRDRKGLISTYNCYEAFFQMIWVYLH